MLYLMNSAVLTTAGTYKYTVLDPYEAYRYFDELRGEEVDLNKLVKSAIGYEQTAAYMSQILNYDVEVNRDMVTLEPGDEALICKLKYRVQDPKSKGQEVPPEYEWGLLVRIA